MKNFPLEFHKIKCYLDYLYFLLRMIKNTNFIFSFYVLQKEIEVSNLNVISVDNRKEN